VAVYVILGIVLFGYVESYIALSRAGYRRADQYHMKGFDFVPIVDDRSRMLNRCLIVFYSPLIGLDVVLGTGRSPGSEPMLKLEK
jgi:hypothetical protein